MKREMRLLDYIGEIDSKYVEDAMASPSEATRASRVYWRKVRTKAITAAACLVLVTAAVFMVRLLPSEAPVSNELEDPAPEDPTIAEYTEVVSWHGKSVQYNAALTLEKTEPGTALTLYATAKPDSQNLYQGKSLQAYAEEAKALDQRAEQLAALLKEGPQLQYGELLYTDGLPDGTVWTEEYYRERMAYYGDLLDRYFADGIFLQDSCAADLEQCRADAEAAAVLALEAQVQCQREILQELYIVFKTEGHAVSLDVDGAALNLTISPQDFIDLEIPESKATVVFVLPMSSAEEDTALPECPPD